MNLPELVRDLYKTGKVTFTEGAALIACVSHVKDVLAHGGTDAADFTADYGSKIADCVKNTNVD